MNTGVNSCPTEINSFSIDTNVAKISLSKFGGTKILNEQIISMPPLQMHWYGLYQTYEYQI